MDKVIVSEDQMSAKCNKEWHKSGESAWKIDYYAY